MNKKHQPVWLCIAFLFLNGCTHYSLNATYTTSPYDSAKNKVENLKLDSNFSDVSYISLKTRFIPPPESKHQSGVTICDSGRYGNENYQAVLSANTKSGTTGKNDLLIPMLEFKTGNDCKKFILDNAYVSPFYKLVTNDENAINFIAYKKEDKQLSINTEKAVEDMEVISGALSTIGVAAAIPATAIFETINKAGVSQKINTFVSDSKPVGSPVSSEGSYPITEYDGKNLTLNQVKVEVKTFVKEIFKEEQEVELLGTIQIEPQIKATTMFNSKNDSILPDIKNIDFKDLAQKTIYDINGTTKPLKSYLVEKGINNISAEGGDYSHFKTTCSEMDKYLKETSLNVYDRAGILYAFLSKFQPFLGDTNTMWSSINNPANLNGLDTDKLSRISDYNFKECLVDYYPALEKVLGYPILEADKSEKINNFLNKKYNNEYPVLTYFESALSPDSRFRSINVKDLINARWIFDLAGNSYFEEDYLKSLIETDDFNNLDRNNFFNIIKNLKENYSIISSDRKVSRKSINNVLVTYPLVKNDDKSDTGFFVITIDDNKKISEVTFWKNNLTQ